ncbi:MAG: hypothetical protein ABIP55_15135 [Tepidisphaeraceae bacterium]
MNRILTIAGIVLSVAGFAAAAGSIAAGSKVVINADGVLEIDGRKTFLIGFIMPPLADGLTPNGKNGIAELADAGATFLRTGIMGPNSRWDDEAIARETAWQAAAARNGMHCLVGLRYAGSVQDDKPENEAALRKVIARFKDHPGMGAYYGIDEPQWGKHPVEPMERAYRIIKELDPDHPVWICQAPRGSVEAMKAYDGCGDATGGDIYPISYPPGIHSDGKVAHLGGNRDISLAGDFTRMMMAVATPAEPEISTLKSPIPNKPVWMCLQISWSGVAKPGKTLRFPTFPEQRFMTYQSIINGARGLIYFGGSNPATLDERDRALGWNWRHWQRVLRPVIEEIGTNSPLYPALVAPGSTLAVQVEGSGIEFCVREAGDDVFLLACRRDRNTSEVTFRGLPVADGTGEVMFESPRRIAVKSGAFTDWFAPFEVHVYRFTRKGV